MDITFIEFTSYFLYRHSGILTNAYLDLDAKRKLFIIRHYEELRAQFNCG